MNQKFSHFKNAVENCEFPCFLALKVKRTDIIEKEHIYEESFSNESEDFEKEFCDENKSSPF